MQNRKMAVSELVAGERYRFRLRNDPNPYRFFAGEFLEKTRDEATRQFELTFDCGEYGWITQPRWKLLDLRPINYKPD